MDIMRLDEVSTLMRLQRRTKLDRRIMRLTPVFILDEFNRRRKKVCLSSSQTNYASHIVRPSRLYTRRITYMRDA